MNDFDERPSKSERKREAHDQQALGEALAGLKEATLAEIEMPEALRDALAEWRRTRSHEGRRRQMQYIGKLMRHADLEPLREAVAAAKIGGARDTLALHEAEAWRARLVDSDEALTAWTAAHPRADLQRLRTLIRNARRDVALPPEQRHGRAWRELFQFIKPWVKASDE
ncbi:MAG TPA: ribosome biogenesis factor YjgA [Burkholderiaceae bacterium]|nr:ribosome biogenesis factor YjgA [Burkholderiaceae bacterium]